MFKYALNDKVEIEISGEKGKVFGRAEYIELTAQYWVKYKAADGRAVSNWFYSSDLVMSK